MAVTLRPVAAPHPHLLLLPRVVAFVVYAFASTIVADLDCLLLQFPIPFRVHFILYLFSWLGSPWLVLAEPIAGACCSLSRLLIRRSIAGIADLRGD